MNKVAFFKGQREFNEKGFLTEDTKRLLRNVGLDPVACEIEYQNMEINYESCE